MNDQIDTVTNQIIKSLQSISSIVKTECNSQQQEAWLNALLGFKEELEPYIESTLRFPSIEDSMKQIINNLNNMTEDERRIFVSDEQMAVISQNF